MSESSKSPEESKSPLDDIAVEKAEQRSVFFWDSCPP